MPSNTASFREPAGPTADRPDLSAFGTYFPLRPLAGGHRNAVWLTEGKDGLFVAKSTRRSEDQLRWLAAPQLAARRAGFVVPEMLSTWDGRFAPAQWTLEPFLPGPCAEQADLARLAPQIARFHAQTATLPQRPGFASLHDLAHKTRSGDLDLEVLPTDLCVALRSAWADVNDAPLCGIHGDIGRANIVMTDKGPALLDWDEARQDCAFLDGAAMTTLPPAQARAHLALEIASCWQPEPEHAQTLLRAFSLSASE